MKAIVSGALANKPLNGGNAWTRLSWVTGLRRLGFEVCFIEQLGSGTPVDQAVEYFKGVMQRFGLEAAAALFSAEGNVLCGLSAKAAHAFASEADLLFNISGHLAIESLKSLPRCKVYFDDDPGFTQFWHALGSAGARLQGHDFYFTIGHNIGHPGCDIPTGEIQWRYAPPPVVLDEWPVHLSSACSRLTTVASWRGAYGPVEYAGKKFGLKVHEFRKFMALPQRARQQFEIALQIHPGDQRDLDALHQHGWKTVNPQTVAAQPEDFRRYLQESGAEFSVAQGIYVETNSGWFSDRTIRYLASGKPVLVQDTGFSAYLPVGKGLLSFRTLDEAIAGVEAMMVDYPAHCRAARAVAEQFFDSDKVIRNLLREIGLQP